MRRRRAGAARAPGIPHSGWIAAECPTAEPARIATTAMKRASRSRRASSSAHAARSASTVRPSSTLPGPLASSAAIVSPPREWSGETARAHARKWSGTRIAVAIASRCTSRDARGCGAVERRVTRKPSRPANAVSAPIARPRSAAGAAGTSASVVPVPPVVASESAGAVGGSAAVAVPALGATAAAGAVLEVPGATVKEYVPSIGCPSSETMRHSTR